ncbi:MAG: hypothetical protein RL172_1563 [Bacteroidota bacterium]|jgi:uncharacterized protein
MRRLLTGFLKAAIVLFVLLNIITAFHAYKFTHFYDAASAPAPGATKSGWQGAKEIFFGAKAYKQPAIMRPGAEYQPVIFTTADKIKLQGWQHKLDSSAKGTVLLFHGHGSKKSAVLDEAAGFTKMGYNTLLIDFRAHGNSGGNTSTIGFYETEEVKLAYQFIKEQGEQNIILWGISMGAATVSKAIHQYHLAPRKVILEMPFASILQAAEGRIKMMGLPAEPLAGLVTFWGGVENGFWAFNMKPATFVRSIQCPVLLQWGKNDPRVQQAETDEIYRNIIAPKKLVEYANSGHQSLCTNENEKWMKEVNDFLQK